MGVYATMLFVLGLIDRLAELGNPRHDEVGIALEEERLPQRIRLKKHQSRCRDDHSRLHRFRRRAIFGGSPVVTVSQRTRERNV